MAWSDFRQQPFGYLRTRGRLLSQLIGLARAARRRTRASDGWPELIDFIFGAVDGYLKPQQIRAEIQRALEEIENLRPRRVLEIGTAQGGTFFLLSRAAAADAKLISLDLPAGRWGGGYSNWKRHLYRSLLLPEQSAEFIRSNSHLPSSFESVKTMLGGDPLDLLFIDGDHSYEGVKADFELYSPLVRPGGLIVLHDIAFHEKYDCHVDQFWAEVKERYPSQEIIQDCKQGWAGIGILRNEPVRAEAAG
jgi:predicted O-methyltransferase YrrM